MSVLARAAVLPLLLPLAACASVSAAGPADTARPPAAEAPAPPPPLVEGRDYAVYRSDGTRSSLAEIVQAMEQADAVLVGEEHDDAVAHRLQLRLLERAFVEHGGSGAAPAGLPAGHPPLDGDGDGDVEGEGGRAVVLSLEMFERDVQAVVDEYLADLITESHFRASARPWENYETDYRPLIEFAKAHRLDVVAANAPRRYVNRASRLGRESLRDLPESALRHLPPLPYPEPSAAYRAQWDALMVDPGRHVAGSPLDGQTLWDAAMAHAIARALERDPATLVLHVAGGFHVERGTGIPEAILHYRPWTRVLTVAARPTDDPGAFDPELHAGLGDFVVLTRDEGRPGG